MIDFERLKREFASSLAYWAAASGHPPIVELLSTELPVQQRWKLLAQSHAAMAIEREIMFGADDIVSRTARDEANRYKAALATGTLVSLFDYQNRIDSVPAPEQ